MRKIWKHFYLIVGKGSCDSRNYYCVAESESEARAEALRYADTHQLPPVVRVIRSQTRLIG